MSRKRHRSSEVKCPSCQTLTRRNAKFCHECGNPLNGSPAAKRSVWKTILPVAGVFAASGAALAIVLGTFTPKQNSEAVLPVLPQPGAASSAQQNPQAVDLSSMTPRQAADRLFNRVMAAYENQDMAQAVQFAPMALEAYKLVETLDADAEYHVGLINYVLGNMEDVRRQIEILRKDSPDHLLASVLEIKVAKQAGDEKTVAETLAKAAAVYEKEMKRGLPEYVAHRVTIETLRKPIAD